MNKYLQKIASNNSQDAQNVEDLKTTGKVMAMGTLTGGIGMGINHALHLDGSPVKAVAKPFKERIGELAASAVKPKNLAAAGVLGAVGGVGDYLVIHNSHKQEQ